MTKGKIMEGVFAINKPTGLSSAQVVRDLQTYFNPSELFAPWLESETKYRQQESHNQRKRRREKKIQVKIGHGGTLDPLATGVLIAGIGKGTKSLQDFLMCTKVYETVVLFGTSTDSYDRVGKVLKRAPYDHITKEMVEDTLGQFRGKFMQLPPLFSALKMNGKPLYEYAREGKEIPREIERRPVDVLELELIEWMEGGTHEHEAPTDEAGHAEVNVANKLWKQENALPAKPKSTDGAVKNLEESQVNDGQHGQASADALPSKAADDTDGLTVTGGKKNHTANETNSHDVTASSGDDDSHLTHGTKQEAVANSTIKVEEKDISLPQSSVQESSEGATEGFGETAKVDEGRVEFEQEKRKLVENQDDLVHERPPSKQRKKVTSSEDAVMSGGLAAPEVAADATPNTSTTAVNTHSATTKSAKGPPAARLRMTVTSGFYVRSLCHDLGAAVGSVALMAELERTRQGDFELGKNVLEYDDLALGEDVWGPKVEAMLEEWYQNHKPPA
ncbi:pseudouridine synthase [Mollisia scopiformis]|uniref:tRNA pseudouridine(55) synthase n=1 Tax=Mollisia scopiformis TaxID=149040 RepID=A0A132BC57_MOLSC|nr:pseudouridine synthase [Mollisia scopiformis]KUJ09995.1 pseudouridine synthase [Mollisia scopiformis]